LNGILRFPGEKPIFFEAGPDRTAETGTPFAVACTNLKIGLAGLGRHDYVKVYFKKANAFFKLI